MSIQISEEAKKAINTDYASGEMSRRSASRFKKIQRGSVRLVNDLYRTEEEERIWRESARRIRLPGFE